MAGGKETPRQKLINLMYLVLLAMLALNVSASIMDKFAQLNESLEILVEEADAKSQATYAAIEKAVGEDGREDAMKAFESAKKLAKKAEEVEATIAEIKKKLTASDTFKGEYRDRKSNDLPTSVIIGPNEKGTALGKAFEQGLQDFVKQLNETQKVISVLDPKAKKDKYKDLNLTPDGKTLAPDDPNQRGKSFLMVQFDHTPMIAALASLTEKQARVANLEAEILNIIKGSLGAKDIKFDEIFPMASAESQVVAAGTDYKARLFITARSSASSFKPKMFIDKTGSGKNYKEIEVNSTAEGEVKFKTSLGGKPDPKNKNLTIKKWKGKIIIKNGVGEETPYEDVFEYKVSKPVLQIQSGSVSALYSQCGNELIVNCPALGANYQPVFNASGAQIRKTKDKSKIVIIPNRGVRSVTLSVSSGGQSIGKEKFGVRRVPKPIVVPYVGTKKANLKDGIAPPRSMTLRAEITDDYFKEKLPKDSKYGVGKGTVQLVRGRRGVGSPVSFSSGKKISLTRLASSAKPGDRLVYEVKTCKRRTFLGGTETIPLKATEEGLIVVPLAK